MRWAEIRIETTPEAAELISEILMEQGCRGAAMVGENPVIMTSHLPVDDLLEPRLLKIKARLKEDHSGIQIGPGELTVTFVEDEDWANAWKRFYKPMRIGKRIVVKPSWEEITPSPSDLIVELDPGMAFGSGTHATTSLCMQSLEKWVKPGDVVLDIGTGSGILAITAAKLGASRVIATDDDPVAVKIAAENAKINHVDSIVNACEADLIVGIPQQADVVVSNIIADVVIRLAPSIPEHLKPGGVWISSGIINTRREDVEAAIRKIGMEIDQVLTQEEWVCIIAISKAID